MADEQLVKRDIVMEADAQSLERFRKEGQVRGFTVFCDEQHGGDNTAPSPMGYFALSVAF